jgi:hypothetical protein
MRMSETITGIPQANMHPRVKFHPENIPEYLRKQAKWTVFFCPSWKLGDPKPTKKICLPNGSPMLPNYEITKNGVTFDRVSDLCIRNPLLYPAFYFEPASKDGIIFIDVDCENGISPSIPTIPTYCEKSVYGGFHCLGWYKGKKPIIPGIDEIYMGGRWIVLTGECVDGRGDINDLTDFLKEYTTTAINEPVKRGVIANNNSEKFRVGDEPTKTGNREPTIHKYVWSEAGRNIPFDVILCGALALNRTFKNPHPDSYIQNKVVNSYRAFQSKVDTPKDHKEKTYSEPLVTEIKVSEKFVASLNGDYVYNVTTRQWHVWNGVCWAIDERNTVVNRARSFVKTLFKSFDENSSPEEISRYVRDLTKLNTRSGISNIVALAANQLTTIADDFDRDFHLLNLQNGTIVFDENGSTSRTMIEMICVH